MFRQCTLSLIFKVLSKIICIQLPTKKRSDLLHKGPIILHDNAGPRTKREVIQLLTEEYDWEVLNHPPCSPDLLPCDFFWFPQVKNDLCGRWLSNVEEVNHECCNEVHNGLASSPACALIGCSSPLCDLAVEAGSPVSVCWRASAWLVNS